MLIFKNTMQARQKNGDSAQNHNTTNIKTQGKITPLLRILTLSGMLASCVHAQGKADQYIHTSMEGIFGDTKMFECDGSNLSAICTAKKYDFPNTQVTLHDFRYTVNYRDTSVIERFRGNLEFGDNYELKDFLPKSFECSDFTQFNNTKQQIGEQLVCSFDANSYRLWLRLRANAESPLFTNENPLSFVQKTAIILQEITQQAMQASDKKEFQANFTNIYNTLHKINMNLYGIDIAITRSQLPQKTYEYLFADMISYDSDNRHEKLAQTLYNSGVGYMYGNALGYVWGNDNITNRTKDELKHLLDALRDFSMLDTNIKALHITLTNRTKIGVNLAHFLDKIVKETETIKNLDREQIGKILDIIGDDTLNRYRIDVQALRGK